MNCLEDRCFSTKHLVVLSWLEKKALRVLNILFWRHWCGLICPFSPHLLLSHFIFVILIFCSFLPHLCLYSCSSNGQEEVSLTFSITANLIILQCSTQVQPSPSSLSGFLQAEFIPSFLHVSSGLSYVEDYASGWPVIVNPGNCQCLTLWSQPKNLP